MLKNHLITAWRNILHNRLYSILHILGLSVGLAVGILVLIWVQDELSFDRFHPDADRIFRIVSHIGTGDSRQVWGTSPSPLAVFAKRQIPGVENGVRTIQNYTYSQYNYRGVNFTDNHSAFADPEFFRMFHFPIIEGNKANPFSGIHSVVLSQTIARKFFGAADPIGKVLVTDNHTNLTVSAVMADFPENSTLQFDMILPMGLYAANFGGNGNWKTIDEDLGDFQYNVFVQLKPGVSPRALTSQLTRLYQDAKKGDEKDVFFTAQPLTHMHLYEVDGSSPGLMIVRIFLLVGILILCIACINYVNLSTARSLVRAKEVSMRKIIGAGRPQLFFQFITETVVLFIFSALVACALAFLLLPAYGQISGKHLEFRMNGPVWNTILVSLVATLVLSGIYPALLLSSFRPIEALRGKISSGIGSGSLRRSLVVVQFCFSIVLITGTLIIGQQLKFIRSKSLGFDRSYVFSLNMGAMQSHFTAIRNQLLSQPAIREVASADDEIISIGSVTGDTHWEGKEPGSMFLIHPMGIDERFIPLMKLQMVAGSNFSGAPADSAHIILNETAVREAGIKNPIGKQFTLWQTTGTIIGVVRDFNFASLKEKIQPQVFYYDPAGSMLYVRTTGKDAALALGAVQSVWKTYNAAYPFAYNFLDDEFNDLYKSDQKIGVLFNIFGLIAIFISCLGLFGLATYTAQVKTREIGIRKVVGASVMRIITLLSAEFAKWVIISIVLAIPISAWLVHLWLQDFAYHIYPGPGIFILAGAGALFFALFTVSFQAIRTAMADPVKSLRSE